jgi:DNA-binding winged helix-turn-helix (wHTH) protein/tetratricopeptide (TPR) repeat protein
MSLSVNKLYRFDEFVLDPSKRTFAHNGKPVSISPKAFDVLTYLVSNPGRVVTKEELLKAIWPDSFVEEGNLAQHISWLRKSLGEGSDDIVTVPGRGYQFTAQVQTESPADLLPAIQPGDTLVHGARERTRMVIEELALVPVAEKEKPTRASARAWTYYTLATVGVLTLAVFGGWKWWRPAAPPDFLKIMVADFTNATGDATFDHTLKKALEIDLEQSPFLDVMSPQEAVNTLQLMAQKNDAAIVANVATEVCVRSNRQVLLAGSIASVGHNYLLTLEATDCGSGKELVSAKKQVSAKEDVLGAIDAVADRIRKGLGESAKSLESFQVPIQQATTPSLDALKAYSLGVYLDAQGKEPLETLPFYQQAAELDPRFCMAYNAVASEYINLNEYKLAAEYYKKAIELSGHLSEREKFVIQGRNLNVEQRIKTFQMWAATYPHDFVPWFDLAADRVDIGQDAAAIPAGVRALELEPNQWLNYYILARAYERTNRFAEAKAVGARAVQRNKDPARLHALLFEIAFAEQDQSALSQETQWSENHPDDYFLMDLRASAAAALGKRREAEGLFRRAYEAAVHDNLAETADDILLDQSILEFWLGLPAVSHATLGRIRKPDPDSPDFVMLRAKLGDPSAAERFLVKHKNETQDVLMAYLYVPLVRATLAVERRKPLDAIAELEAAAPYDLVDYNAMTLRGEAYLRANRPDMAATEYQKILAHRGLSPVSHLYPLAYLGLARAYALENHKNESRGEYEKFFAFWKDADADVPILKQARAEYAKPQ